MSDVIDMFSRVKSAKPTSEKDIGSAPTVPTKPTPEVAQMLTTSAAMNVIAALAFYAGQGWDDGKKAREAMPALQNLLATKGIGLVLPGADHQPT